MAGRRNVLALAFRFFFMNSYPLFRPFWILSWAFAAVGAARAASPSRPNVVLIYADDIGYGDLSCYGAQKVKTPEIDKLAAEGIRFTDGHSPASTCTPSRYAMMTGQYAFRRKGGAGIASGEHGLILDPSKPSLPKMMQEAGYRCGVVGKWHLGLGKTPTNYNDAEIAPGPREVGFDYSWIIPATGDRVPCVYVENGRVVNYDPADPISLDYKVERGTPESFLQGIPRIGGMKGGKAALWKDDEMAMTLAARGCDFIELKKEKPFFLFLSTHGIHAPRVPHAKFTGKSECGVRGDAIVEFDWTVGQILACLERNKLDENTLVILTSDNGGALSEGTGVVRPAGMKSVEEENNGHTFNGVLRGGKGLVYEGGTRLPFITRWKGRIRPGVSHALVGQIDLFASLASLLGQELGADAAPDSQSVLPALLGTSPEGRGELVAQDNNGVALALRSGKWKFIPGGVKAPHAEDTKPGAPRADGLTKAELYDLSTDLGERTNLAAQYPDFTVELAQRLEAIKQGKPTKVAAVQAPAAVAAPVEPAKPAPVPLPPAVSRTLLVGGDFIHLPLMQRASLKDPGAYQFSVEVGGKALRIMHVQFPAPGAAPDFHYSADVREFKGQTVTLKYLSHDAGVLDRLKLSDEEMRDPQAYSGPHRPRFHFSPRIGWMNDINGSYYQDGLYHMFYQANPATTAWSTGFDMHWGHSVSKDLVHWEEWPMALFPDHTGRVFSGTGLVVSKPVPGLLTAAQVPAPVLFFTATNPFSQHLATTYDGGRSWKRFAGNPVIPRMGGDDRDPKVVWHEESGHYVMIVYVGGKGYVILRSLDLVKWEETSVLPGWFECPEFFPYKSPTTGEKLWILLGAYSTPKGAPVPFSSKAAYMLGRFDGKTFSPVGPGRQAHLGPNFYASLIFMNAPGDKPMMVGWTRGTRFPGEPFNQCASVPLHMEMRAINGLDTLCFQPVDELNALRGAPMLKLGSMTAVDAAPTLSTLPRDVELDVVVKFKPQGEPFTVGIRNNEFRYDPASRQLLHRKGGKDGVTTELHPDGSLTARFLIDRGVMEAFWNGGEAAYCGSSLHTETGPGFAVTGDVTIQELTIYPMKDIWKK